MNPNQLNPNQLRQLEKLAKVFNTENVISPEDIEQVVKGIVEIIKTERENIKGISDEHKQTLRSVIEIVSKEHDKLLKSVEKTSQNAISEATEATTKALQEVKRMCDEVMAMKPKDGEKGEDADEEKIVEDVLAKIKLPEYEIFSLEEKGEEIVAEINALPTDKDEYKIDASHIKNLPEGRGIGGSTARNLYQLGDVNISAPANNDVLKYNSTAGIWENGVGGGGATAFTDLTDVPSSYSGQGGKVVAVNVGETGLEFISASGTGTVTSVAATVPTGLTISGSPITTSGTLAIGLDTGYVIPLQSTLDGKANTALSNLASVAINTSLISDTDNTDDLGSALIGWRTGYFSTSILTPKVTADTSAGLLLESANGTDVGLLGAGNTANVEWYGSHNFDTATQDTIAAFTGAGKTLGSLSTATYPSLTELSYVKGVTSAIQTQLNAKVDDGAVTTSGLTMSTARILGRTTASTGAIEEISIGSGLSLSGGTLSATGSGTPAGSNTQIQYNNSGSFGADANFAWDSVNKELELGSGSTILSAGGLFIASGGNGGTLDFSAAPATVLNNTGGSVYIYGGDGNGSGSGGLMSFFSGSGGATGNGGIAEILAGSGGATSGNGGNLRLKAGIAQAGNSNGGSVLIYTGEKTGSGTAGEFRFYEGVSSSVYGVLDFKSVATTSKTFTFPNTTGNIVIDTATQTLSGKTLTEPKFVDGGFIADANGNEMLIFDTVASAVNELTLANAATGANPKLSATGGDTNIGIDLQTKGTGVVNILGNSTQAGEVRIFEDTDNGTNYTGFKAPATLAGNVVYTLPSADGSSGQFLSTNGSGSLSWATGGSSSFNGARVYKSTGQASIGSTLTVLTFDTESYDTNSYHDNSTNNSRLTVPTTGYYRINASVATASNSAARITIRVNGTTTIYDIAQGNAGASTNNGMIAVTEYQLTAGDYVEALGAFLSGTYTTTSGIASTVFSIEYLGS